MQNARASSKWEKSNENNGHGTIITDNRNNQQGFITTREYDKLEIDRKRSASEAADEPKRKKTNKDVKIPTDSTETSIQEKRVVSGDIGQCLNNKKKYPNLDALYEVYANVFKVERSSSIAGQTIILLKNNKGPILQGIYFEIDVKLIELKPGDYVRCVGKIVNNRIQLYKVSIISDNHRKLVPRLFSLVDFVLQKKANMVKNL